MKWFKNKQKEQHSQSLSTPVIIEQKAMANAGDQFTYLPPQDEKLTLNYYHSNCLRVMVAKTNKEFGDVEEKIYLNDQKEQVQRILG